MRAPHLDVPSWVWAGTVAYIVLLLLLDLLVFNRRAHKIEWPEAVRLSIFFVASALLVNAFVWVYFGTGAGLTFFTAYVVEKSLSVDNLFVIAVLFGYFGVPAQYQHRVLFWGIFGAIVMRAVMIFLGVALVDRFEWVLYLFGAFLILTGVKMFRSSDGDEDVGANRLLALLRRALPVTRSYYGEHFFIRKMGRLWATPLFLVLIMIELTDVVFAVDSIPAILGLTTDPYIAFSSNIMAVVGLRALYFLLAGIIERVRYLHIGLALVLVFIGTKMLAEPFVGHPPTWASLLVITLCIGGAAVFSWLATKREAQLGLHPSEALPPPNVPLPDGSRTPPASPDAPGLELLAEDIRRDDEAETAKQ